MNFVNQSQILQNDCRKKIAKLSSKKINNSDNQSCNNVTNLDNPG